MAKVLTIPEDRNEILFSLLWPYIVKKEFNYASSFIRRNKMLDNFDKYSRRIRFWISYCLHQNGEKRVSRNLYGKIIKDFPLSYYSVLSVKKLRKIYTPDDNKLLFTKQRFKKSDKEKKGLGRNKHFENTIKRMIAWLEVKRIDFYNYELKNLMKISRPGLFRSQVVYNLIHFLNHRQNHLQAFRLAVWSMENDLLAFSKSTLKALFPFDFIKNIKSVDHRSMNMID